MPGSFSCQGVGVKYREECDFVFPKILKHFCWKVVSWDLGKTLELAASLGVIDAITSCKKLSIQFLGTDYTGTNHFPVVEAKQVCATVRILNEVGKEKFPRCFRSSLRRDQ